MEQKRPWHKHKLVKKLASLKLAVFVILGIATITTWGTLVESKYNDASAAHHIVYNSWYMYLVMSVFAVNLTAVMIDRWPWKARHTSFVLAHIGLLLLLLGAQVTRKMGVDGSIAFGIGEKNKYILSSEIDLTVYRSEDGLDWEKIYDRPAEFLARSPKDHPFTVDLVRNEVTRSNDTDKPISTKQVKEGELKVVDFYPYALRDEKIVPSSKPTDGAALRFQLQNPNVNMTEWVLQPTPNRDAIKDLGPAVVVLTPGQYDPAGRNAIVLKPKDAETIEYSIHSAKDPKKTKKGVAKAGDVVETGWMGMVLRILKFIPHAKQETTYKPVARKTDLSSQAAKVIYNGEEHWIGLNSMLKLYADTAVYVVFFANRRLNMGFDMELVKFSVGRYQGTKRAASYESIVHVPDLGEVKISMNEPLKHNGYTYYQSSFQEDEQGNPTASILSVNKDPGRWIKYLGSLLIVLGSIHLFFFRNRYKVKST